MITPKQIERETMSPEKRKVAKNDYFAFYIGRPLSYLLTIPFLYTKISPDMVSLFSIVPVLAGFCLMCFGRSKKMLLIGWLCFFLWNLLDGVDGNIARYKKQFSRLGSVYDAMSGYAAMVLSFFAWGIAAAHHPGKLHQFIQFPLESYLILGALSGIFVLFPRLIMHKTISVLGDEKEVSAVKDKTEYGIIKVITLNLTSIAGFVQVLMLIAVVCDLLDLFTIGYFVLNTLVMIGSLVLIFRTKENV